MRFFVNELNIDLFLPTTIASYDVRAGVLISCHDLNQFIQGNVSLYNNIFKPLNAFECNGISIMQNWINHMVISTNFNSTISNVYEISQELVNLYNQELDLRKSKIQTLILKLKNVLCHYARTQFRIGDILEYTTTISYKNNSIPSKIYLHQVIVN
jgi:hypothetical protein